MSDEKFKVLIPFEPGSIRNGDGTYKITAHDGNKFIPKHRDMMLDNDLNDWLYERNITYSLDLIYGPENSYLKYDNNWVIIFNNKNDALLFKLTWG